MAKYTLYYFKANGRAAVARAILSFVKADWTNITYDYIKDWPAIKKSGLAEYEQLPVLEVNGKKYCESNAINIYLGEIFNLMGNNPEENYQINNLLMTYDDIFQLVLNIMHADPDKKDELKKKGEDRMKFFIKKFEKRYVEHGAGKYFLGDKFTLADIYLCCGILENISLLCPKNFEIKEIAPNLGNLVQRVKENELKEFFEKYNTILSLNL